MKLSAVFLIILTSASKCNVENIDHAKPQYIQMNSIAECEAAAKSLDERPNQRAFCFDPLKPQEGET